ncbi:MAG: hypothetical protein RLZZ156_1762 [Deinococcota bacterium]|jgi:hypothetical protein
MQNIAKFLKKASKWIGFTLCMSGLLAACAPAVEISVEGFVENTNDLRVLYRGCAFRYNKCGASSGGGSFTVFAKKPSKTTHIFSANPVYFLVNGVGKARIIIRKNGKVCADRTIMNTTKDNSSYKGRTEYRIYCK